MGEWKNLCGRGVLIMVSVKRNKINFSSNLLLDVLCLICPFVAYYRISKKKEYSVGAKIATCVAFTIFWAYAVTLILFMFWAVCCSLKEGEAFYSDMVSMPDVWRFQNYVDAYELIRYNDVGLIGMFIHSIWFTVGSSFLSILMHAVTGYIFAKYNFRGKEMAFKFILFTLAIPIVGSLPSMYKIVSTLDIHNSPLFLITYLGGFGSNFLIMYAYFKGIDKTYMEAAEIDGASRFCIFFKIMMPLAVAPCFSLFLLTFIGQWNNYETVMLFLDALPTLSLGLYKFPSEAKHSGFLYYETIMMAGVLLASIPVVIIVALFGDKIMSNVSMGGIKG